MPCNKCGTCCDAILLATSYEEVSKLVENCKFRKVVECEDCSLFKYNECDIYFILKYWKPLKRRLAIKKNPQLKENNIKALKNWKKIGKKPPLNFYTCEFFNSHLRICTNYGKRPPICKDYPFYDINSSIDISNAYTKNCGYIGDSNPLWNKKTQYKN